MDLNNTQKPVSVQIKDLSFTYPGIDGQSPPGSTPLIQQFSLTLHSGDRCLLVGANGAGKTTILRILGGQHMVDPDMVRMLGRPAFYDTTLISSGELAYLGGEWRRDVAFAGFDVPLQMDISAQKMIFGVQGIDPERRTKLIKVLLLDEITVDLDVLARSDLLSFLLSECEDRGATIIYATHIFDGIEAWPSHIAYVAQGRLQFATLLKEVEELKELSLMRAVEKWLRKDIEEQRRKRKERQGKGKGIPDFDLKSNGTRVIGDPAVKVLNNGWIGGRLHSTLAGEKPYNLSSNHVLRL